MIFYKTLILMIQGIKNCGMRIGMNQMSFSMIIRKLPTTMAW